MSFPVDLTAGTLGLDCYPETPQEFHEASVAAIQAEMDASFSGIIMSATVPSVDDQDKLWFNTTDGFVYHFSGGFWVRPHPLPPAAITERLIWPHTEAELWSYQGGDGTDPSVTAPTPTSGAMWEVDHDYDGRFLIAAGSIPDTTPARTVLIGSTTDSQGEKGMYTQTLERANLPAERLKLFGADSVGEPLVDIGADSVVARRADVSSDAQSYRASEDAAKTDPEYGVTDELGDGDAFVNAPAYKAVYFAKRTARRFIKAA